MNFCCGKFEKEHRELSKTSNRMCVVDQERNGKNKRYFFLRIWNERNAYVQIRYCPYCGECLSTFYADDCYINTAMDDVYNIVRATPSACDSATAKKRESSEAKARRKYGLEVCCGELGYLCDLPLDYDSVKFIITEHILEKSISHHYTIDKGGIERCYLKPISALSFGLLYKRRRQWQESEDEPKDDRKHIGGWNFCPYCGKNLHTFYDNPMYANYIEGKCFDYPEKESSLFLFGGYGINPVYIYIASLIGMCFMLLFQKTDHTAGLVNMILGLFGMEAIDFITGPYCAKMFVLCFYTVWVVLPFKILILTSAIASVNPNYYDAARVDGTSSFRMFTKITVPLISPMLFYLIITGFIGAFKAYSDAVALFGSDLNVAEMNTIVGYIYDMLYGEGGGYPSYASAAAIVLFIIVLTITCINLTVSKKHVHYT